MSKLKSQAQQLRNEVDSLTSTNGSNILRKDDWAGIIREDVMVQMPVPAGLTAPNTSSVSPSEETVTILSPRLTSNSTVELLQKLLSKQLGNSPERVPTDSDMAKVFNISAIPDIEETMEGMPALFKLVVRASNAMSQDSNPMFNLENKLFIIAMVEEVKEFMKNDDYKSSGLDEALSLLDKRVDERKSRLYDEITIKRPLNESQSDGTFELGELSSSARRTSLTLWLKESSDAKFILKDYDLTDERVLEEITSGFFEYLRDEGFYDEQGGDESDADSMALCLLRYIRATEGKGVPIPPDDDVLIINSKQSDPIFILVNESSNNEDLIRKADDLTSLLNAIVDEDPARGSAENLVMSYFDEVSRTTGDVLSKESAGRLQDSILRDVFEVNGVSNKSGAVIFLGRPLCPTDSLGPKLAEKYSLSPYKDSFGYTILRNEVYPEMKSMEEMAIDSVFKSSPAVVVYPATWNSTVTEAIQDPFRRAWRSFLISCAIVTTTVFAIDSLNNVASAEYDATFLPLAFSALSIQNFGALTEVTVAALKGFNTSVLLVPSLRIGSWGPRILYTSMPKNRNDLFDAAFTGFLITFVTSFALLVTGLDYTAHSAPEDIADFPSISASILKSNTLVAELFQWRFPGIFDSPLENNLVHMHWLAFSGLIGLISSIFQLIPLDNSIGSKMCFAIFGFETSFVLNGFASLFRLAFLLPFVFNFGEEVNDLGLKSLLVDFFFASQFAGNYRVFL